MEEQEPGASPGGLAMALVEPVDGRRRSREQLVVAGDILGRGVEPVRQQGEPKIALAVPQVMDFQAADLGLYIRLAGEERRHDDERPQPRRHAILEIEPGQRPRAQHVRDRPVDEGDREVGGRREREDRDHEDAGTRGASIPGQQDWYGEDERRDQRERPEVATRGGPDIGSPQPARQRRPNVQGALERKAAVGDQVVAGISAPTDHGRFDVVSRRRGIGHRRSLPGDLDLGQARTSRQVFNGVPVAISSREVHLPERTSRTKDLIDQADAFDELGPVEPRDEAHARDHVSDRHVHRRLALVLEADHLLGSGPLGRKKPLLPAEDGGDRRVLIAQALEELDAGRRRQRRGREPAQGGRRDLRAVRAEAEKAVGELVRLLPRCPASHDLLRDAAEVVDEEDPEADRDRP